jgi:predicted secreted protein
MHFRFLKGLRALVALGAIAVCGIAAAPASAGEVYNLHQSDSGGTIVISPGDDIMLRLRSCESSCGYSWSTTTKPSSMLRRVITTRVRRASGLEVRLFHYHVRLAGTTTLTLKYYPPGRRAKAAKTFHLRIVSR